MNDRAQRIEAAFQDALAIVAAEEREAFLSRNFGDDESLLEEVCKFLRAQQKRERAEGQKSPERGLPGVSTELLLGRGDGNGFLQVLSLITSVTVW